MPPNRPKPGFTLAELLIALALLGIIAAFTIPKVLQASAEQERVAKLRETVSTLEQAWYNALAENNYVVAGNNTLYDTILPRINVVYSSIWQPTRPGEYMDDMAGHPCGAGHLGHVIFQNGVLVAGLRWAPYTAAQFTTPQTLSTYQICIDVNGREPPNLLGQDAFEGNWNRWGDFDGAGVLYTASDRNKNFYWGNANEDVYLNTGAPMGSAPTDRVGYWLTR